MKILAIGAHGDDIELGCGGTLVRASSSGHEVKCLVVSESSYENYDGSKLRTKQEAQQETRDGATAMGVGEIINLDFKTKYIPYNGDSVGEINRVLDEFKPDLILTQWVFDTHQDHRAVALATVSAARNFDNILMYEPFPPSGRSYQPFRPQIYIDISDYIGGKIKSIEAHKSQVVKYGPEWIESIVARAKLRGFDCGVRYAETFELLRYKLQI